MFQTAEDIRLLNEKNHSCFRICKKINDNWGRVIIGQQNHGGTLPADRVAE